MSNETDLESLLRPLVGNRVSEDEFPQPASGAAPTWPAIRYSFNTVPLVDSCGDGDDATAERRVTLDLVASTRQARRELRLEVRESMKTFSPPATLENDFSTFDADTKTFRQIMEYLLHGSSS